MAEYMGTMTEQPFVRSSSDIHAPQTPNKNSSWPRGSIPRHRSNTTGSVAVMQSSSSSLRRRFSVVASTEDNHRSDAQEFYGPYAHLRKNLDYGYHKSAYRKERQWLQDSIIEEMLDPAVALQVVDKNNGDVCTTPTEPVCCFTAGAMGAGKYYTIQSLVKAGRFPLLAFVMVSPDEISQRLPEFHLYVQQQQQQQHQQQQSPDLAGELTRKESGYVAELLTLAALQAGKNVLIDGCLRHSEWYKRHFQYLRNEYTNVKIAILHITAPRAAVFQRAADRALETGRVIPKETIDTALQEIPKSVAILSPLADYFCELHNGLSSDDRDNDIKIVFPMGETWDSFQSRWLQTCAWVPGKQKQVYVERMTKSISNGELQKEWQRIRGSSSPTNAQQRPSILKRRNHHNHFSVLMSTEMNHKSHDKMFYGPYSHIRKNLDYDYHENYVKERQWLQDAIISDMLTSAQITDVNGNVCTTPTEPYIVFTAGAMGAGKSHTIHALVAKGRFPLLAFVSVDPDEIRRHLPEYDLYVDQCPSIAGELTRKESGYIAEILTEAALQAGKNVLVDGSLRDSEWYQFYFKRLRMEHPALKIAILHVTAPREAVFQRALERGVQTGRIVPRETLEMALEQVPRSVEILKPLADYFCELNNAPGATDIELITKGETWESFQSQWLQTCAWVPSKLRTRPKANLTPR